MAEIFQTERLRVRELEHDDLDFVAEMLAHEEVMRFWPKPLSRDEAKDWIVRHRERYVRDGYGYWLAIEASSGKPVGQVGLLSSVIEGVPEPNVGYMLHRPYWGMGYAEEGARGVLRWAFEQLGLRRVVTLIQPKNEPSLRVAARLHARKIKQVQYAGFEHCYFEILRPPG